MSEKRKQLSNFLSPEHIIDDQETLAFYSRDQSFARSMKPIMVVRPKDKGEVQNIVKWANQENTPLIPVSSGAPHFRGDTVPSIPGAIIVDLGLMNRIISIDRRNKITIIEPGVTWDQIQNELKKTGLTLITPLMPRKSKSVIASLLEREPTLIPKYQWTILEPLRCCEVIWGNGEKLWTGEAGDQAGTLEERWSKHLYQINPMGPYQTDFYRLISAAQGTMGIVTCASLKCEVLPKIHELYFVHSEELSKLVDFMYKILRARYGYELFILNSSNLEFILGKEAKSIFKSTEKKQQWILILGLVGLERFPDERIRLQKKEIAEFGQKHRLELLSKINGIDGEQLEKRLYAISNEKSYWKLNRKGGCQDIFFITKLNETQQIINTFRLLAHQSGYPLSDLGIYIQPLMQGVCCHCEFNLFFDPNND